MKMWKVKKQPPGVRERVGKPGSMKKLSIALILVLIVGLVLGGLHWWEKPPVEEERTEPVRAPQVVFDQGHKQAWSIHDTGVMGYSRLCSVLQDAGYRVSETYEDLSVATREMGPGDVLIIPPGHYTSYTDEEVEAILDFVERGGGLWVLAEHSNVFGIGVFQNKLIKHFGVVVTYEHAVTGNDLPESPDWIRVEVRGFDASDVAFWSAGKLVILEGNETKVEPIVLAGDNTDSPGAILGVRTTCGAGRVVVTGDSHFLTNLDLDLGIGYGDNAKFAKEVVGWLSNSGYVSRLRPTYDLVTGKEIDLWVEGEKGMEVRTEIDGGEIEPTSQKGYDNGSTLWHLQIKEDGYVDFITDNCIKRVYFFHPPEEDRADVLIDESHHGLRVDEGISGLLSFARYLRDSGMNVWATGREVDYGGYDAVVIANPKDRYTQDEVARRLEVKKLVLLGDFCGVYVPNGSANQAITGIFPGFNATPTHPINDLSVPRGIKFTWYMVYDNESYIKYPWRALIDVLGGGLGGGQNGSSPEVVGSALVYRGSVVKLTATGGVVWARGKKTAWGESAWDGLLPPDERVGYEEEMDITDTPIGVETGDVLGFGCVKPFTNEHYGKSTGSVLLGEHICSWILNPA